jgi:hypothetical protein
MDLSTVITSFKTGDYVVTRTVASTYNGNGVLVPGSTSTLTIEACVQPLGGRELRRLPEGLRNKEARQVYTPTELRTAQTGNEPDSIAIGSNSWQVQTCEPWAELGGYFRAIVTKDGDL